VTQTFCYGRLRAAHKQQSCHKADLFKTTVMCWAGFGLTYVKTSRAAKFEPPYKNVSQRRTLLSSVAAEASELIKSSIKNDWLGII